MGIAAGRRQAEAGQGEAVAIASRFGCQHPAGQHAQSGVDRQRRVGVLPVEDQFAFGTTGKFLDQQRPVTTIAGTGLPGHMAQRIGCLPGAETGEIFLSACTELCAAVCRSTGRRQGGGDR